MQRNLCARTISLLAISQRSDSTNLYAAIQHRLANASAGVADRCSTIGRLFGHTARPASLGSVKVTFNSDFAPIRGPVARHFNTRPASNRFRQACLRVLC